MATTRRGLLRFMPLAMLMPALAKFGAAGNQAVLKVAMWRPPAWDPICTLIDQDGGRITRDRIVAVFSDTGPLTERRDFVINESGWGLQLLPHVDYNSIFIHFRGLLA